MNNFIPYLESLGHLVLQLLLIFIVAQVLGRILKYLKQPPVIGEIMAGILLGPSLLGWIYPDLFLMVFPPASLGSLKFVSELGLILFMFTVGAHASIGDFKKFDKNILIISQAGIVFPFALGLLLAFVLKSLEPSGISFFYFSFFCGVALSITAFPVLARIIRDRSLEKLPVAQVALNSAALEDMVAWILLAFLVSLVRGEGMAMFAVACGGSVFGIIFLLKVVSPLMKIIFNRYPSDGVRFIASLFLLSISASFFQAVGVHALFGAFLAGTIIPRAHAREKNILDRLEGITSLVLLPAFFAVTGLRTELSLLSSPSLWIMAGVIIVVAIFGKWGGVCVAARFCGYSWKDSSFLGVLMNTRGLMELIVLNIGLELGVISPTLFSMMVMMALVTTFMTGPCLSLIQKPKENI